MQVAVEAFNDTRRTALAQQAEARLQEAQGIENALARETLPYAAKKAQLEVENLRADIGYRAALADRQRAEAASINEERMGALEAGSSVESLLGNDLYGRVFRRAPSASTSEPKPAAIGLDKLPIAEEPQRNFDLDSGTPMRLDSSAGNPLMDTFGQSRKPNPLESFDSRMADFSNGPAPGEELAPIGSGGNVIESSKTYSPEDRDAVLASAANTLQTRGGKSTNPLTEFNAPDPEPMPEAAAEPTASPLSGLLNDYRQASTVLKSRQMEAGDRRQLGRLKGAAELVDQQFINNATSDFGMGPVEFDTLAKMDPTIVAEVEKHHRASGGRDGWSGSIDYVTALRKKQADMQVARDLGLVEAETPDLTKEFNLAKDRADLAKLQAAELRKNGEFTRADLIESAATQELLRISGAPQVSDQEVALSAYQKMKTTTDQTQRTNAETELNTLIPRLAQNGYAISLDGLSAADAEEEILDAARSYPDVYKQMFVVKGGAATPLAEALEVIKAAKRNAPAKQNAPTAEKTAQPQVDVVAKLEAELDAIDPNSDKAKRLRVQLNEYKKGRKAASYLSNTVLPAMKEGMLKIVPPPDAWRRAGGAILEGARAIR